MRKGIAVNNTPVGPDHDQIQAIPEIAGWSENLVAQVHDPTAAASVWAHWSRIPEVPHVWEGVIAVYLPYGELLVSRSFGPSPTKQVASSGPLSFACEEPGGRWRVRFDGMARRTTSDELAAGSLTDGEVERVEVELELTGLHPLWSAHGNMTGQVWASAHLEQACRIVGEVVTTDGATPIAGVGFRDHSYGPRDYSGMSGDTWCSAVLPSGHVLLALNVWQEAGPTLAVGYVWDGTALHDATALELPRMADGSGEPRRFTGSITTALGTDRFECVSERGMTWTMDHPVGMTAGARAAPDRMRCVESPARISFRGETAAGWIERSMRPRHFRTPKR